jgi:hypothetical protein
MSSNRVWGRSAMTTYLISRRRGLPTCGRLNSYRWPSRHGPLDSSPIRSHTNHHAPALLLWCNGLLCEGAWWAGWWGSLDGMEGLRFRSCYLRCSRAPLPDRPDVSR